jgi:hypothetical protein
MNRSRHIKPANHVLVVKVIIVVLLFMVEFQCCINGVAQENLSDLFAFDGAKNIRSEESFGIINGHVTVGVNYRDVGSVSGLYAPPYASSDFTIEMRLFGEKVQTKNYQWYPYKVKREGEINGLRIVTSIVLMKGERAGLLMIKLSNQTDKSLLIPFQLYIRGGVNYVRKWEFLRPDARKQTQNEVKSGRMIRANDDGTIVIQTDIAGLSWFELGSCWDTQLTISPGEEITRSITFEIGKTPYEENLSERILADPSGTIDEARQSFDNKANDLFAKLPLFRAADKRLEQYYYRSLVVLLTNKWNVPEFILHPYYGSGAILGGCVGNYLWEFGLPAQIFPLYDSQASKEHIKQFLKIDITKHFLFDPMTGSAGGQWYQVNQDKIVELIYYYVLHTGDVEFLKEEIGGMSIFDYVLENALWGDYLDKPVSLIDYGPEGENHLELRRGIPYRGILPDVNALRYQTYMRAFELSKLAGKPNYVLVERAQSLKSLLREKLWSSKDQWFYFQSGKKKDIRYTNFMYTLIGTGVFEKDIELTLLSHLNENEFLSNYGIHSISKKDIAYDQTDIDHGGGGSYIAFPPLICQRLYNAGYKELADDLFQRHLWWGERLPYWGDSNVANFIGYRQDTPLQSDFSALSGAQSIIFGLFGVRVNCDGSIFINPTTPVFSGKISLKNLKLLGKEIDILADPEGYQVNVDGKNFYSKMGKPIIIP